MQSLIESTANYVRRLHAGDSSGHDWQHVRRVWGLAIRLGRAENADLAIVQLAALLHDVDDWKLRPDSNSDGPNRARRWLRHQQAPASVTRVVCEILEGISFKGAGVPTPMRTVEGRVVQDADRLDALGAIGVARAFAYGGAKNRPLHHPQATPNLHSDFAAYRRSTGTSVNHFHEKLLLLKDRMQTPSGRQLAAERHRFMLRFLQQFQREWELAEDHLPVIEP